MFKGHPKGLIAASLANMGERFGFYTMMAILVLFLQAKFGLTGGDAGLIYSVFYFSIYILAFVGGLIADRIRNYKGTILTGILVMALGYLIVAMPTETPVPEDKRTLLLILTNFGLFVIAFGNGLFKGNLQALVGQMYDNEKYGSKRDSGFSLFYMFINVGAIFAPFTAIGIRNWWLNNNGFNYNPDLPAMCHKHLESGLSEQALARFNDMQAQATNTAELANMNLDAFASKYLEVFSTGFHYAFGIAVGAMVISLLIYLANKNKFPSVQKKAKDDAKKEAVGSEMSTKEIKQRLYALFAVFGVVIFFWFSFHQNGLTLTMFARDYTDLSGIALNLGFVTIEGAEIFQSINPIFIVFLTPIVVGLFGWLRARGLEPSTPKKIAIGMFIAGMAYVVMILGSMGLPEFSTIDPQQDGVPLAEAQRVTPMLLIGTYFILTMAELFISPLGISFVSKVAPPQYQGIMQGGWLGATALGNQLLFIGAILYESVPLWMTWSVFVVACFISMGTMIFMLKWLERVSK
ncbi:Di-/tripeptide transporter [Salinivirga cyanobacteriivorans]|uniref:Di-/tripeptide transporter n=1 Tax=Salinivirga cyanobacteriivorans TaxID=1307839 RepID=A0A0S2I1I3_9BACT|nr:peptide MFS transporter [Salinivirga cyanobacteriivorans]ALO16157.1 Di-/tripeptide transporter [Salinivirga cyanobacteriivorans]